MENLEDIRQSFLKEAGQVHTEQDLLNLKARYIGKKGLITERLKGLSSLPKEQRPEAGKRLNELKRYIEEQLQAIKQRVEEEEKRRLLEKSRLDVTVPGAFIPAGKAHPVNQVMDEIIDIFVSMGFAVEEGPEVELDYYNFEALNIPKDHPARDMQDTFYIKTDKTPSEVLLRTHTSPVQIRGMLKRKPPFRFIAPGKVYRRDADITHTPMFHQVEGLMVGERVSFAHLKGILEVFIKRLFGPDTPIRFRPSYFPFTEPSAEVDIGCIICGGKGCRVCKQTGWLEVLGSGMVHPNVFRAVGYDTEKVRGFAFGMGVERLAMLKFGIDDIRLFFENDIRFLRQF